MAEPPEWWVKYKPLRWVFGLVVLVWLYTVIAPRFSDESAPEAPPETAKAEIPAFPDNGAVKPAPVPPSAAKETSPATAAPVEPPKPAPVVSTPPPPPVVAKAAPAPPKPAPPVAQAPASKPAAPAAPVPKPAAPAAQPAPAPVIAKAAPPANPRARFTSVEAERVTFIGKLRSYDSVETLQGQLGAAGYRAEQSTIEKKVPPERYPPFRSDTLLVPNYKHGEHEGRLTLEFFNDRLYQAQFIPKKPREYLQWLRSNDVPLARRPSGRASYTQGHLQVVSNIDFATSEIGSSISTAAFVMWEDTRLVQQMREWGPLP